MELRAGRTEGLLVPRLELRTDRVKAVEALLVPRLFLRWKSHFQDRQLSRTATLLRLFNKWIQHVQQRKQMRRRASSSIPIMVHTGPALSTLAAKLPAPAPLAPPKKAPPTPHVVITSRVTKANAFPLRKRPSVSQSALPGGVEALHAWQRGNSNKEYPRPPSSHELGRRGVQSRDAESRVPPPPAYPPYRLLAAAKLPPPPPSAPPPTGGPPSRLQDVFYDLDDDLDDDDEPQPPPPHRQHHTFSLLHHDHHDHHSHQDDRKDKNQTPSPGPSPAPVPDYQSSRALPSLELFRRTATTALPVMPARAYLLSDEADSEEEEDNGGDQPEVSHVSHDTLARSDRLPKQKQPQSMGVAPPAKSPGARPREVVIHAHVAARASRRILGALLRMRLLAAASARRDRLLPEQSVLCDLFERRGGLGAACRVQSSQWQWHRTAALRKCLPAWHKWAMVETWVCHEGEQAVAHCTAAQRRRGWRHFRAGVSHATQQHWKHVAAGQHDRERRGALLLRRLRGCVGAAKRFCRVRGVKTQQQQPGHRSGLGLGLEQQPGHRSVCLDDVCLAMAARRTLRCWLIYSRGRVSEFVELYELVAKGLESLALLKMGAALRRWARQARRAAENRSLAVEIDLVHRRDRLGWALAQWRFRGVQRRRQARTSRRGWKYRSRRRLSLLFRHWAAMSQSAHLQRRREREEQQRQRVEARLQRARQADALGSHLHAHLSDQLRLRAWHAWKQVCAVQWFALCRALKRGLRRWAQATRLRVVDQRFQKIAAQYRRAWQLARGLMRLSSNALAPAPSLAPSHDSTPVPRRRLRPAESLYMSSSDESSPEGPGPSRGTIGGRSKIM